MSCANSSPDVSYPSWLHEALAAVAESSFCVSAEPCERDTFLQRARAESPWLQARVRFVGGMVGEVICTVPESLVRELTATFAGIEAEAVDAAMIQDLVGEFGNMVCGRWLRRVSERSSFRLSPPQVTRTDTLSESDLAELQSLVGGRPAAVRVVVTGW